MKEAEYQTMFGVEDIHWWYRGLRAMVLAAWEAHGSAGDAKVLDVGCGTGAKMAMMARSARVTGLDVSIPALTFCRRRGLISLCGGSATALPYPSGVFDGVLLMDVLCHRAVPDKGAAVREAARVLAPGGVLIVNVPAYKWLYSSHDAAVHTDRRFTRGEVVALVRSAGLEPLRATYWNTLLFPAIAGLRLWRRVWPAQGSDLEGYSEGAATRVFAGVLGLERAMMRVARLPFGLSIFVVARKAAD